MIEYVLSLDSTLVNIDERFTPPIMYRCINNNTSVEFCLKLLLLGFNIFTEYDDTYHLSFDAVITGNVEILNWLIKDYSYTITDNLLLKAAESGSLDIVEILINFGININYLNEDDNNAITFTGNNYNAAEALQILILLLDNGCDIENINIHGDNTLILESQKKHIRLLLFHEMLNRGALIDDDINKYGINSRPLILDEIENRRKRNKYEVFKLQYLDNDSIVILDQTCFPLGLFPSHSPIGWLEVNRISKNLYYSNLRDILFQMINEDNSNTEVLSFLCNEYFQTFLLPDNIFD